MTKRAITRTDILPPERYAAERSEHRRRVGELKRNRRVDVGPFVERKRTALATHASQIEESLWAHLPTGAFGPIFGEESFIRAHDTTGAPLPEADLFVGLR